jgi:hypothetical protein
MYCQVATKFKNEGALIIALMETGEWTKEQIEVHPEAQHLYGFQNDMRKDTAHIIVRKKHIGRASNDIGFRKTESGEYEAIISKYDRRKYNDKWLGQLKGNYAFRTLEQQQKTRGRNVIRERLPGGKQRITIGGYR